MFLGFARSTQEARCRFFSSPSGASWYSTFATLADGLCLHIPLDTIADLPADLDFAARTMISLRSDVARWRRSQWRSLEQAPREFALPWGDSLTSARSESASRVSSHFRLAVHELRRLSIAWPDAGVSPLLDRGATIVDEVGPANIYRSTSVAAAKSLSDLLHACSQAVASSSSRRHLASQEAAAMWEKSEEERRAGIIEGWFDKVDMDRRFGSRTWAFMYRFAVR